MTHGSLFSGIGGFEKGFADAGIETLWQVEIDGYCRKVLERHFPGATRFTDVRKVHGEAVCTDSNTKRSPVLAESAARCQMAGNLLATTGWVEGTNRPNAVCPKCLPPVDILTGGFPCQDISVAGKQAGIDGERSGLWSEFHRIIGELRPRYVVIENVANLVRLGLERVLSDLAEIGYDAEWQIISANDVGAPHLRKRIWIVAYPQPDRCNNASKGEEGHQREARPISRSLCQPRVRAGRSEDVAYPQSKRSKGRRKRLECRSWWATEPNVGRVASGVSKRVDRLKGLGNAVVPQIPYIIGQYILKAEARRDVQMRLA